METKTIKAIVREVLEEDPKTRNSDKWLILQVMRKLGFKIYIDYYDLKKMPSFESIRRSRQFWQNTMGICPPEEDIDALRNRREAEFKTAFLK
jgi:hypothetical protein